MWEAAMSYASTFKQKDDRSLGPKRYRPYNKLRALLRRVFPNYISFTTSLISASQQKLRILC